MVPGGEHGQGVRMRLLVLGGTRFLGRGVVDAALAAGDQVTTFTRGQSGEPPAGVEALHGDRHRPDGMDVLRGREWDAVVDTCGFVPTVVNRGAELLAGGVGHYVFVSSVNAYPGFPAEPTRDDSPVHDCGPDEGSPDGEFDVELYGPYKVGSERAVERHFPGRAAHVRAGLIVGPYDLSGRFPYWIARMALGGEVMAPAIADTALQLVDARDLGAWCVHLARERISGAYAATGPQELTFGELLAGTEHGPDTSVTWVDESFLIDHNVGPWMELPLWLGAEGDHAWDIDTTGAERDGLRTRPLLESAADTLRWLRDTGQDEDPRIGKAGLDPAKEKELLAAWHSR